MGRSPVEDWLLETLDQNARRQIIPAIEGLEEHGPSLGRPFVDRIKARRHHNMNELRSIGGSIRILFAFDTDRPLCRVGAPVLDVRDPSLVVAELQSEFFLRDPAFFSA